MMATKSWPGPALVVTLAVLNGGCAAPVSPKQLITVLPALPLPLAAPVPSSSAAMPVSDTAPNARRVIVRQVAIPEYLQARAVRYRATSALITEYPDAVWAERPEVGLTRELGNALSHLAPSWQVCTYACEPHGAQALRVEWSTLEFRRSERLLIAHARWVLPSAMPAATQNALSRAEPLPSQGRADFQIRTDDDSAVAMGRALGALTRDLAAAVIHQAR